MPQDSLRSIVYRSFVTCDDPRGVVEGKAIRISKTGSTKMEKSRRIESETQPKNLNRSSSVHKEEEKEKMSCKRAIKVLDVEKNPSSYQLVEVKKGAQKLNQVIDSWSKGISFEGQSKDIAKDLLKGALDLQESLMMLGKLQEASAKLKRKQKEKPNEEVLAGRIGSDRFENQGCIRNVDTGYQKARHSVDGSSRDCYEELRDVIRDGLARQNLLPNRSYEERALWGRSKVPLSPDIASTSSSRSSSIVYSSHDFTSSDSFSSKATEEKPKGSNLIAKLMGLEELPSKAFLSSPQKQLYSNKIKDQKRPVFDIDLPKVRKSQSVVQKVDQERMTLDEIIEMMQCKGLLSSNKHQRHQTNDSRSEKRFTDDAPPIVIMKPHRLGPEHEFCKQNTALEVKAVENRKIKAEASSIRKLQQEKAKAEDKEVKTTKRKLPSYKQKASVPIVPKPQRKEQIEKKVDKIQKMAPPVRRKPVDTENAKSTNAAPSTTSSKQAKPQKSAFSSPILKRTSSSTSSTMKSGDRKKNVKIEKLVSGPLPTNVKTTEKEDESLQIRLAYHNQAGLTETDPKAVPSEQEEEDSKVSIKEIDNGSQHSLCAAPLLATKNRSDNEALEEVTCCTNDSRIEMNQPENNNHDEASVISDTSDCKRRVLEIVRVLQGSEPANSKLLLDCVNEFLDHENLRQIPTVHPLLQTIYSNSRLSISEDQLMREVTYEIENLRNYSKLSGEGGNADTVYGLLARDLWRTALGGVWSTGWKDGCTLDEVEESVFDLEKIILSKLIDDLLMELVV